jgi:hypothetical protein
MRRYHLEIGHWSVHALEDFYAMISFAKKRFQKIAHAVILSKVNDHEQKKINFAPQTTTTTPCRS